MTMVENVKYLTRTCKSVGMHIEFVHQGDVDRCLCGAEKRPCSGDCGRTDFTWLGPGIPYGNCSQSDTYQH